MNKLVPPFKPLEFWENVFFRLWKEKVHNVDKLAFGV